MTQATVDFSNLELMGAMILVNPETAAQTRGWPAQVQANTAGQTNAQTANPDDGSFRATRGRGGVRAEAAMTRAAASQRLGRQLRCAARAGLMRRQVPCT
jgi:hypothetical protein